MDKTVESFQTVLCLHTLKDLKICIHNQPYRTHFDKIQDYMVEKTK